jgi:di/tricarboxylate transporter
MVLQIAFRIKSKAALSKLPWGISIMIAGVLIYVGLLEKLGVLHSIGDYLVSIQHPSLVRFSVTIVGTILANFESSSIAVLGLVIPVAVKSMVGVTTILSNSIYLGVLSGCLVVMCASPFHIGGALILSEAEDYDHTFKQLLFWVLGLTLVMPFITFLL